MKILIYVFPFLFFACSNNDDGSSEPILGMSPVYEQIDRMDIGNDAVRDFGELGKIVYQDPYIFINETFRGIHVIDNSTPTDPKTIAFWKIPGAIDFTLKENFLYAENGKDLITLDKTDIHDLKVLSIVEDINPISNLSFPANYTGWFECADPSLGIVVSWEEKLLADPKCWR